MTPRVALIIPYFGKWPEWIELFFYSCGRNPFVDFIFYTDCPLPEHLYKNTIINSCSFENYKQLVSECLGIDYNIKSPYKLTDLKPFVGAIHAKELKEYDFWGFGDLDLVFGDLGIVVNEDNLKKYDLITTHSYHIAGHFTLCRNNEYYRNKCFNIKDWQNRLVDDKHYAFDEGEWSDMLYPTLRYVRYIYKKLFKALGISFWKYMEVANKIMLHRKLFSEFYTSPAPKPGMVWKYDLQNGKIFNHDGLELPYLHFLFFKKTPWYDTDIYWREGYYTIENNFKRYNNIFINEKQIYATNK